jgi:hypothetical protein
MLVPVTPNPARLHARDAGLARARRATVWCAALAVVAAGATAGALGRAIPGHSTRTTTSPSTTTAGGSGSSTSSASTGTTGATSAGSVTGATGSVPSPAVQAPVASSSPS